jgi:uncharacterized membrane protein YkvA (DUF1232 family)
MVIYTCFFEINLSVLIYEIEGLSMKNKFFTQMLQDGIRKALRNPKYRWLTIIAALFYLISPLDIIPDAIPILGWIDDGIIVSFVLAEVSQILMEQMKNRNKNNYTEVDTAQANTVIDVDAVTVN